jgi:pyroglutamyl-peptidase
VKENPSWKIVSQLPDTIEHKWLNIRIVTPSAPTKSAYHDIFDTIPRQLEETKPDIVLHIGLDVERTFFGIERGAARDGYDQYPDVQRKVFTRAETKRVWEKSPARLDSSLDLERVLKKWRAGVGKGVDVRCSDDVGSFVCGFLYYTSLHWFWKKDKDTMPVVFLHVPLLQSAEAMNAGTAAVIALIRALAESR